MMGGTLALESAPGRGSRFTVEIPVEVEQAPAVPEVAGSGEDRFELEPGQGECRVLVVEDSPENAMMLEQMLRAAGFQVRVAANGTLAVEQFQPWQPHFIWMDLRMPELSGTEATRRIRALEGGKEVKIAAMTASAFLSDRDEVMAAGMDDFIRKPYRPKEVFQCMARHLGVRYGDREEPRAAAQAEEDGLLRPEALAALPAALLRELEAAVVTLNRDRIAGAIERVRERDRALASTLTVLWHRFAYTVIYNAVKKSESEAQGEHPDNLRAGSENGQ